MFRSLCLMLILVLSLGNVIRLGRHDRIDLFFWLSFSLLLFSAVLLLIETMKAIRTIQTTNTTGKRIRLRDLKKYDDIW